MKTNSLSCSCRIWDLMKCFKVVKEVDIFLIILIQLEIRCDYVRVKEPPINYNLIQVYYRKTDWSDYSETMHLLS